MSLLANPLPSWVIVGRGGWGIVKAEWCEPARLIGDSVLRFRLLFACHKERVGGSGAPTSQWQEPGFVILISDGIY